MGVPGGIQPLFGGTSKTQRAESAAMIAFTKNPTVQSFTTPRQPGTPASVLFQIMTGLS
jgi:hypothetical protein